MAAARTEYGVDPRAEACKHILRNKGLHRPGKAPAVDAERPASDEEPLTQQQRESQLLPRRAPRGYHVLQIHP